jgi:hypothetical protein
MHGMHNPNNPDGRADTGEPTMHKDWRAKVPGTTYASKLAATKMALAAEETDRLHHLDSEAILLIKEGGEDPTQSWEIPSISGTAAEDIIRDQRTQAEQELGGMTGTASNPAPFGPANKATRRYRTRNAAEYGANLGRRAVKQALEQDFIDN